METKVDYLIIGAGIIGINIARALSNKFPQASILILEKENDVAMHSSGRNSGVLHTGFYYKPDSLKAKFTRHGNAAMSEYCLRRGLKINKCGKVVVTKDENELETLNQLYNRGVQNNSGVILVNSSQLKEIEPCAKTFKQAIFSPHTATVDPKQVVTCMLKELEAKDKIEIRLAEGYSKYLDNNKVLTTKQNVISAEFIINAAGLYADKIAKDFGASSQYVIVPFKGIYLKYNGGEIKLKRNVYPVPNINNPFLGVHFTVTANNEVKIGPTAIPVLWRENYNGLSNFKLKEFFDIVFWESKLFLKNSFNFRTLALGEIKKYYRPHLLNLASALVDQIELDRFNIWSNPGIRAQLLNKNTMELLQDFLVEKINNSLHILNAVSPGFTCSIPFSEWIVDKYIR